MSLLSLSQFVSKYDGKTVGYPEGSYVGECLSLVKWYIRECFGITPPASGCNGARCYWSKFPSPLDTVFKKVPNTPELIPERGWIAVWDENTGAGYGHIGVVLGGATTAHFDSFDANWGGRQAHRVRHDYTHVYGFLAPKETMPETMTVLISEFNKIRDNSETLDRVTEYLKLARNSGSSEVLAAIKQIETDRDSFKSDYHREMQAHKEVALELMECQQSEHAKITPKVTHAGEEWEINGLSIQSGNVQANYKKAS